ncbi:MAG: hypothetical protein AAGA18_15675 [Verrucomicrobiota bacterium]
MNQDKIKGSKKKKGLKHISAQLVDWLIEYENQHLDQADKIHQLLRALEKEVNS